MTSTKSGRKMPSRKFTGHKPTPATRIKTAAANVARSKQVPGVPTRKR